MRIWIFGIALSGIALSGCDQHDGAIDGSRARTAGRYAGIGTYQAGRLWREVVGPTASKDGRAARTDDDEHVIVVIDSHSGEIRQCGDYSGFCVAMNPWLGANAPGAAPVQLNKHAADVAAEEKREAETASPPATTVE